MERRIDEIKLELSEPVPVHFHGGNPEPHLTPLSYKAIETLYADALSIIQRLEAQVPYWISVEERLPEDSVKVLVYDALNQQEHVMYAHDDGSWWDERDRFYCNVEDGDITHWMPLPPIPKEVPDENGRL